MLRVSCPPKLNLFLRVVARRPDGYHELETLFQSVSGGDLLMGEATSAPRLDLVCDDPDLPVDGSNLVLRAAELLRREFPERSHLGAQLELLKRTPVGAGMGGGSVDGAAALVLLNDLWHLGMDAAGLHRLAADLGSDPPFFLQGGAAVGRGRGEVLEPVESANLWLVLVKPSLAISTPWAFRQWRAERCGGLSLDQFLPIWRRGCPREIALSLRNDLEPGVAVETPVIAAAREWLLGAGALGARMTGSGSVVFGIAEDRDHASRIAAVGSAPGSVWITRTLNAAEAALVPTPGAPEVATA